MSSHHFVKEGQEPPLVLMSWTDRLGDMAQELLAWQPLFVVHHSVLEKVLSVGLKPDVIVGESAIDLEYLQPIEVLAEVDVFEHYPRATFLVDLPLKELAHQVSIHHCTIYSSAHKVYLHHHRKLEKWLPAACQLYYFQGVLAPIPMVEGKVSHVFDQTPQVIFEEV